MKLLRSIFISLLILPSLGCRSKLELSEDKERELYRDCIHYEVTKIVKESNGLYKVENIDSTKNFYIFYLHSQENGKSIIGVANRNNTNCIDVIVGLKYNFKFSCDISSKGNYSLYIFEPKAMFYGHEFQYRVPLGNHEDYLSISAQNKIIVLKVEESLQISPL
jgi:hypothetical protein